ncbi:ABC transporter ATP-binding protein [Aerococcus tenax]|uniref:ABC transporter ATP-binding protein n=1 Tax=Aerococcus tenax TaxID=3078812 RepID=UPI000DCBAA4C|nr:MULTISPECIES: ABC transporter ATP-binding protein [Aerococcus]KAA9300092.1 ABC transporter ATP-binding protein [Aerococcus tenax]MDK6687866.1 ABC transporter ATP-binding protein [Aerococcus urinae]MDK8132329.1 ABC transporter ATP-binding protein [Aerococcus urinae]MDK8484319.1 ABC transporter ATP-binding protein [Aerococcus urinae]MDL5178017.1 ABC transporter ATP-binding protein [Aerococcus tenax]
MAKVLEVSHLNKLFHNKKESFLAVKDVSLTIDEGEILSIIGPNGAGKTTLLSMLGGYLLPSSGSVLVNGVDVLANPHHGLIGVSFGGDLGFYDKVSAQDNLSFFADLANIPTRDRQSEVDRVLDIVKLTDQKNKTVEHYSKGMKQRLHIARALLGKPALLLLDEPTNGIDVEISQDIHQTIRNLASQEGLAVLLTSHMMGEVESLAKRIILLGRGEIQYQGSVKDIVKLSGVEHIDRPATLEESYLALAPRLR